MINRLRGVQDRVTDFNVGSVARSMLEASAIEIEELYQQMFIGLREAIPVSIYNAFGFGKLPQAAASGLVRFSTGTAPANPVLISAGTRVRQAGGSVRYIVQADAVITAPAFQVDVLVSAEVPGKAGNTLANTISDLVDPVPGIVLVSNPAPFVNGREEETEDERIERFADYVASLPRGTPEALVFGAKTVVLLNSLQVITESVAFASVVEPYKTNPSMPVGLVQLYVHNGAGGTSAALVSKVQLVIDGYYETDGTAVPGYKAAGVIVNVIAATDTLVNVTGPVTVLPGYDINTVLQSARAAISAYIGTLGVGKPVIRSEIISKVMEIEGVYNFVPSAPTADVTVAASAKAVPGTLTLTGVYAS